MSDSEEKRATRKPVDVTPWVVGVIYWLIAAPLILSAASRFAITPLVLVLVLFDVEVKAEGVLYWVLSIVGLVIGAWLVWLGWKQARKALPSHAA